MSSALSEGGDAGFKDEFARCLGLEAERFKLLRVSGGRAEIELYEASLCRVRVTLTLNITLMLTLKAVPGSLPLLDSVLRDFKKQWKDRRSALMSGRYTGKLDGTSPPLMESLPKALTLSLTLALAETIFMALSYANPNPNGKVGEPEAELKTTSMALKGQLQIRTAENASLKTKVAKLERELRAATAKW